MDALSDDCLIIIFKFLGLRSRLAVTNTCKRWRRLVVDSSTLMDDVSQVYFDKWLPDQENSEVPSILAGFSHLKNCRQLALGPGVGHGFLLEQRLKDEMDRFGKVSLIMKYTDVENSIGQCLPLLPSSVKRLQVIGCWSDRFALDLPDSVRLEDLDMTVDSVGHGHQDIQFDLPTTLVRYGFTYWCYVDIPDFGEIPLPFLFPEATAYFLQNLRVGPLLSELNLNGLYFTNESFSALLSTIRDDAPNLHRISFHLVFFEFHDVDGLIKKFSTKDRRLLPFKWVKIESCQWDVVSDAARLLLSICNLETLVIKYPDDSSPIPPQELSELYKLTPMMKQMGTKLELTINSVRQPRALENIRVPFELSDVLTKIELINVHYTRLLQVILNDDDSFILLTEIRLESCIGLGDATLQAVAVWCKNLKKLKFKPHHRLGLHVVTDQCLVPFLSRWNDRKSVQLTIECLQPANPFGGFNLPIDQETGDFQDGKKWMVFRKGCVLDGCDRMGTRLVIWDQFKKSMIITDYKRNFDHQIKISVMEGKCILKEKMGAEFEVNRDE